MAVVAFGSSKNFFRFVNYFVFIIFVDFLKYEQPADLWAWAQHGYNEADLSESQDDLDDDAGSVLTVSRFICC